MYTYLGGGRVDHRKVALVVVQDPQQALQGGAEVQGAHRQGADAPLQERMLREGQGGEGVGYGYAPVPPGLAHPAGKAGTQADEPLQVGEAHRSVLGQVHGEAERGLGGGRVTRGGRGPGLIHLPGERRGGAPGERGGGGLGQERLRPQKPDGSAQEQGGQPHRASRLWVVISPRRPGATPRRAATWAATWATKAGSLGWPRWGTGARYGSRSPPGSGLRGPRRPRPGRRRRCGR